MNQRAMNNAEKIGKMLEGMGFVPYPGNQHFQKPGYGQNWQKWEKEGVAVFRKDENRWYVTMRMDISWTEIYHGKATPSLIREVLEVNGLVENQQTPLPLTELKEAIDILTERKQTSQDPVLREAIRSVVDAAKEHLAEQYRLIYEPNAGGKETNPSPFWNKFPETKPNKDDTYLLFVEPNEDGEMPFLDKRGAITREFIEGEWWHDGDEIITHWAEIPPIDFEDSPDQDVPHSPETKSLPEEMAGLMERFGCQIEAGSSVSFFVGEQEFEFLPEETGGNVVITPETLRDKSNEK